MPAVKIKSSSSSSSSSSNRLMTYQELPEVKSTTVLVVVDGEDIEVYTGKEAEDKLNG